MKIKPNYKKYTIDGIIDWDKWLEKYEANLKKSGYNKYIQNMNNEDFGYWKTFKKGKDKIYLVGVLFYDFRKYPKYSAFLNKIDVMHKCMLLPDNRIDMKVSKNIDLPKFEEMSKIFYKTMSKFNK